MRKYRTDAVSQDRIDYVVELVVGLMQSDKTAPLVPPILQVNERLESAALTRQQAEHDQIESRVQVRFADDALDNLLRSAWRTAEVADGGKRGAISQALFPEGITPIVVPTGESQHAAVKDFVVRAQACTVANADKVIGEWLPRIEEANAKLKTALEERTRRATARAVALAVEESARDDHELAVDKLMGEVRALFPKDRKRWKLIFPEVSRRSRSSEPEPADHE